MRDFTGHTPGPWRVEMQDNYMRLYFPEKYIGLSGDVARGYIGNANAHLIAAAPDLLAAVNTALMHMIGYVHPTDAERELIAVLRKALQEEESTIIEEIARERARYRASHATLPTVVVLDRQNYSRLMDSDIPGMIFGLHPRVDMNLSEPTIIIHGQEDES